MIRKALIGTSPIGYDYRTIVSKCDSDTSDSPNPILDCPLISFFFIMKFGFTVEVFALRI
jgi:hypothetical protein